MANVEKSEAQKQTTIEEGTELRGTLNSRCQVLVRGSVDGDLTAPAVLVSPTGTVTGNVKAATIRSEGVLAGHVDADDVYLSGTVRSDTVIRAKTLEVKLQRHKDKLEVTFGACVLEVGEDPAIEARDTGKMRAPEATPESAIERDRDAAQLSPKAARRRTGTVPPPAMNGEHDASESPNGHAAGEETGSRDRRSVPPPG